MGWKISCIIANEGQAGYLGTAPEHSSVAARKLLGEMKIPVTNTTSMAFFDDGLDAIDHKRRFCIGAYKGATMLAGIPDLIGTVEQDNNEFINRFVSLHPDANVFAFDLSSTTNYFAYVLFENSVLRRKAGGDADRGLIVNEGTLLEEEKEVFKRDDTPDLVDHGEALAFNICKRFFGCPFDEFRGDKLHVEIVTLVGPAFLLLRKLLGR